MFNIYVYSNDSLHLYQIEQKTDYFFFLAFHLVFLISAMENVCGTRRAYLL